MGIDVKVHMNPKFGLNDVVEHLKSQGCENIQVNQSTGYDHFVVIFDHLGNRRMINYMNNLGLFGSPIMLIGKWGNIEDLMESIVQKFGGVFIPDDSTNDSKIYTEGMTQYNEGDAVFVLKWALAKGLVSGSTVEDVVEAQKHFEARLKRSK